MIQPVSGSALLEFSQQDECSLRFVDRNEQMIVMVGGHAIHWYPLFRELGGDRREESNGFQTRMNPKGNESAGKSEGQAQPLRVRPPHDERNSFLLFEAANRFCAEVRKLFRRHTAEDEFILAHLWIHPVY
jgi:hypothetical protein